MIAKGNKSEIEQGLKSIEGIHEVQLELDHEEELWSAKITTEERTDVREEVFYKMAKINCPIYEMKSKKVSLEEIFLELTAADQPATVSEAKEKQNSEKKDEGGEKA